VKQAVILAAGLGSRLSDELSDRPKGMLRIGDEPIIAESVSRLVSAGIDDVLIVTGHMAEHYEEFARRSGGVVTTVHNPRYAESGSMYSLWCARERIRSDFLLLESDLVYEFRALAALLAANEDNAVLLSGPTGAGDEVFVAAEGGRLTGMSKDPADLCEPVVGELVGITRLSSQCYAHMCRIAEKAFSRSLRFDYETDCLVAAAHDLEIHCILRRNLLWGEIDDPGHLARVRDQIYPEIRRRDA
jgi:2-aminoethylphosphonate-pyruvate transaminase